MSTPGLIHQGSPEWHALRCGKVTASRIGDVMRTVRSGVSADRKRYLGQLVAERLTGVVADQYQSLDMKWGVEQEPAAAAAYAFYYSPVRPTGFIDHPTIAMTGCSPDRLVGENGLLEIKCPITATHIATLLGAPIDPDYIKQMQWQMACTGRHWCDFASFDPRMPDDLQLRVTRVQRDDRVILDIASAVEQFLAEVAATESALRHLQLSARAVA